MTPRLIRFCWRISFLLVLLFAGEACRTDQDDRSTRHTYRTDQPSRRFSKPHHRNHKPHNLNELNAQNEAVGPDGVPAKARNVLDYIRQNGHAPAGYVGGRIFGNFEKRLPRTDASNRRIRYQEWDVNPKTRGRNRGTERLITGSDSSAYYTDDHYNSFIEIK